MWLRFNIHASSNGFRRVAEVWAAYFERSGTLKEVSKTICRGTHDIQVAQSNPEGGIKMGTCEWGKGFTHGSLQTKGQTLQWDLKFETGLEGKFKVVPDFYGRTGILKSVLETPREDLQFNGTVTVNGRAVEFRNAPGMHSHFSGPRNGHSWTWVHSNSFVDEQGNEAPMVFEGLTSRTHFFGKFLTPRISAFYFLYRGREHIFNTFWSAVFSRSKLSFGNWTFRMDKQDLSFRGEAKAELKDFAGMTFEDTDGSLIYHSSSVLSDLTLHVYRQGKIESSYFSKGSATYETASRERSPYVQVLI